MVGYLTIRLSNGFECLFIMQNLINLHPMVEVKPKRTVVLGASPNPSRYSYTAVNQLLNKGHIPLPVGIRAGKISDIEIQIGMPKISDVDTVTLYISPKHQDAYEDYILSLAPKRLIFNPGTENLAFGKRAKEAGIEVEYACTLVMLSTGQF